MADLPAPADVLPHRPPFLFVDELLEVVPGESARGRWRLTGEEAFFAGHFPGRPTLPGVLMVEALAQVGALAVLLEPRYAGKLPLFGGIDGVRFRRQVEPGEVLDLRVRLGLASRAPDRSSRIVVLHGEDGTVTGLLVDSVRDVLRIPEDQMRSASGGDQEAVSALLVRGDEFVSLLDLDRVLDLGE